MPEDPSSARGNGPAGARRTGGGRRTARPEDAPGAAALGVGLLTATACFGATFRGPRERFWSRMTSTGLVLGSYALLASRPARQGLRIRPLDVIAGLASAATLYLTFRAGDRFARQYVPGGDRQIREIYTLRTLRPRGEIALRLVSIVGPAEELFWRGLVQASLMRLLGRWRGAALGAAAYGAVHVVTGNFTLMGAAGVAGVHWCLLYAAGTPLGALVVSHVAWDTWIFLVQPTGEIDAIPASGPARRPAAAG